MNQPRTRRAKKATKAHNRKRGAQSAEAGYPVLIEYMAIGGISVLALMHLASVVDEFRAVAGLHRWLMTYAEGFHRRGLVGTIFQGLATAGANRPCLADIRGRHVPMVGRRDRVVLVCRKEDRPARPREGRAGLCRVRVYQSDVDNACSR